MAIVRKMVSDITGTEAAEDEFITVTIRKHPATREAKALDALPEEVSVLQEAKDLVTLEIDGVHKKTIVVALADFRQIVPDEIVQNARPTRGRRPGYSPKS